MQKTIKPQGCARDERKGKKVPKTNNARDVREDDAEKG